MALGRAFIEVHADTRPFARELGTELDRILKRVESTTVKRAGTQMGETIATETGDSVRKNSNRIGQGIKQGIDNAVTPSLFTKLGTGLIDSLDDGVSGLPVEIKAILGKALIILAPVAFALGSGLAGAIVTGLLGGLGGVVIALVGSQFEEVRDAATNLMVGLRATFLTGAAQFIQPILDAIGVVRTSLLDLMPDIQLLFRDIVQLAVPLAQIFTGLISGALPNLRAAFQAILPSIQALAAAAPSVGEAIGNLFASIAENENLPLIITDITRSLVFFIDVLTVVLDIGLDFYALLLDLGDATGFFSNEIHKLTPFTGQAADAANQLATGLRGTIIPLEDQEKQLKENNRALKEYLDYQFDIIGGKIEFEQGIDDLTEALKRNGDTLKLTSQAGRDNATVLLGLARNIIDTRNQTILITGDVAGATATFEAQRAKIYAVGRQFKLTDKEIDDLIASLLAVPPPVNTGVTPQTLARLALAISRVQTLTQLLKDLETQAAIAAVVAAAAASASRAGTGTGSGQQRAALSATTLPGLPPLTQTAPIQAGPQRGEINSRAAVNVYIGNNQLDAYVEEGYHVRYAATARELNYGYRGI